MRVWTLRGEAILPTGHGADWCLAVCAHDEPEARREVYEMILARTGAKEGLVKILSCERDHRLEEWSAEIARLAWEDATLAGE